MPEFKYTTRIGNKRVKGIISASSEKEALNVLRSKNMIVIDIKINKPVLKLSSLFEPKPGATAEGLTIFTRQLSTMISAGVPLLESLLILAEQEKDKRFKIVIQKIADEIRGGKDLSESLSKYPKIFSDIYRNMIKAGEASGQLDTTLLRLAEYIENAEALKKEIKSAMTYPVVSLFLIISIVSGLLIFIIPKFEAMFKSMGIDLPLPTVILLGTSKFLLTKWYILLATLFILLILFKIYAATEIGRYQLDWLKFRLPVFGNLFKKVAIARFTSTFSTLLKSGVPIVSSLEIVAATSGNKVLERAILSAKDQVIKGEELAGNLEKTKVFPIMVTRMIGIGEKTGSLEALLDKISEFYNQQVSATVKALTSLIEPILIVIMGILVGGIVLAIFLPILKIQAALKH